MQCFLWQRCAQIVVTRVCFLCASALVFIVLPGCQLTQDAPTTDATATLGDWGVQTEYLAPATTPGNDFYRYVNQGWLDSAEIPAGLPRTGAFIELVLQTEAQVSDIVKQLDRNASIEGSPDQQLAGLYDSYMNSERRNALGISMLREELSATLESVNHAEIARRMAGLAYTSIISAGVDRDPGNPERYILMLRQGGLGLPGRDYYLKTEQPYVDHRSVYLAYIEAMLDRIGVANPGPAAADILAFETALAQRHWPVEETRDVLKNYNVQAVADMAAFAPGFDWPAYFSAAGYDRAEELLVMTDTAVQASAALFGQTPLQTLRNYTAFHYLNNHADLLSDELDAAWFDLYSRHLKGIEQPRPRDQRAIQFLNRLFGEPLGRLYVERYFPEHSKQQMEELVSYLRQAFAERLTALMWMDDATRAEALEKLEAFTAKIGYPDKWRDFSAATITDDALVDNVHQLLRWYRNDSLAKLDEPARSWEWAMNPQTVNAYYSPSRNEIVFPAAILQPPFFDPAADPAVNFGAIGVVIGHELGHGFDDQGSRYDGSGALREWWSSDSRARFEAKASHLVEQFNAYSLLEGTHVNGQLSLGENIGDLGGVAVAYTAYQNYAAANYQGLAPVLDGFTAEQRFFLGYAQLWRNITTEDWLRQALLTDPHSPGEFRVNGILRNFDPWYEAFNVESGDALFLPEEQRISIW